MTPKLNEAASKCPLVDFLLQMGETPDNSLLLLVDLKIQLFHDLDKLKFTELTCVTMLDGRRMFWVPEEKLLEVAKVLLLTDPAAGD